MSTHEQKLPAEHENPGDYARMYYAHQYDRMAKLEDQRLTITNIVISISVLAVSVAVSNAQTIALVPNIEIHVLILLANLFAVAFIWRTLQTVRVHQARAKSILEQYAPELAVLDKAIPMPRAFGGSGPGQLQLLVHAIFILLSVVSIYLRVTGH